MCSVANPETSSVLWVLEVLLVLSVDLSTFLGLQQIPHSGHGDQVARLGHVSFNLLAEAVDELLEKLAVSRAARAPDVAEQALGGEGVAGIGKEHLEQAELQLGQADRRMAGHAHGLALQV